MGVYLKDGDAREMRDNPRELLRKLNADMYQRAKEDGMSLSVFLEREDPSNKWGQTDPHLDAFGRVMKEAGIHSYAMPHLGFWPDSCEKFDQNDETRALFPEWAMRVHRKVVTGLPQSTRAIYGATDVALGTWLRPYQDSDTPFIQQIVPPISLDRIVALTTPVRDTVYRTFAVEDLAAKDTRYYRIAEATEFPRVKITGAQKTVNLHKFGVAIEVSYEQLRRERLNWIELHIQRIGIQDEQDKVVAAMDVLQNGDGNSNAAVIYNLTALDPAATPPNITLKAWVAFKMKFAPPYRIGTALAQSDVMEQLMLLNTGTANIPLVAIAGASNFGGFEQINPGLRDNVAIGWTADMPTNKIVGFDDRFAVQRLVEVGGTIQEIDKFITRQTQVFTLSQVEGYAIFDKRAARVLNLAA